MRISDWSSDVCSSDLTALALALDAQGALRPDLRLLVMSATLDGAAYARLMQDAPVIESEGRTFPLEYRYLRSEEHTSELQSLMRISYAVFCLKKKRKTKCQI